jgi:GAF domain-containing protein
MPFNASVPADILAVLLTGKAIHYSPLDDQSTNRLIAPILIRGELIGVIGFEKNISFQEWQQNETIMLELVATQMGLILENNRLFAATQLRLKREQALGEITTHIRETLDLDTVLQTAVRELRQAFKLDEVEVRLGTPPDQNTIHGGNA